MPAKRLSSEDSATVFGALGDVMRMRLVERLSLEGPLSIARLTDGTDVSRQAITKHLGVLADAGIVQSARIGRETLWELETTRLADARRLLELVSSAWDDRIARLRALVEDA